MLKRASTRPPAGALPAILILAALALYLVGNGTAPLFDRDEPRYAQCSRQMLYGFQGDADGQGKHAPDFVVPHFLNDLRPEKPPLIYWLQAASMKVFGDTAFAARFPSALAMTGVLILMAVVLHRAIGPARALWAVFIMATSGLAIMSAKMCLTDATLLLFTTTAQVCLYVFRRGSTSWKTVIILWIAIGLAGLTKGPIVLATLGATLLTLAILDRILDGAWNLRWLATTQPLVGLLIVSAIDGPWLYLVHKREPQFLDRLFGMVRHHMGGAAENHGGPPGFYLGLIWGLFFPWCLLLPTTLTLAYRNRHLPHVRYCLAMVLGIWIFQEIMPTKLPFYILPLFPALALLTADGLVRCLHHEYDDLLRPIFRYSAFFFAGCVIVMGLAPWLLFGHWPKTLFHCDMNLAPLAPLRATILLTTLSCLYAASVFGFFAARRLAAGAIAMGVGAMMIFAAIFTLYLPRAHFARIPIRLANLLPRHTPPGDAVMVDYKEPSLAFYQGGTLIEEPNSRFLETTPSVRWPTWIVMPITRWKSLPSAIRDRFDLVGPPTQGLNYAGKIADRQAVEILILKKKAPRE